MLTKRFVVSAARKLCLSWTGTVSKPGVTQMTSWPGWASGTDLGDLGADTTVTLLCTGWIQNNRRRRHGKHLTPGREKASLHHIWGRATRPGGQDSLSGCLWWSWYEWTICCLVCAFFHGAFLNSLPDLYSCELSMQKFLVRFEENMSACLANWLRFSSQMPWFNHVASKLLTFCVVF